MMVNNATKVLIFGASGMLGSTLYRSFSSDQRYITYGTIRSDKVLDHTWPSSQSNLLFNVDACMEASVLDVFNAIRPDVVINCVGVIKQNSKVEDQVGTIELNALLPHRLAKYCSMYGSRLIHFSTDCVFSGAIGGYREGDVPDACDLYGRSKLLGEVSYGDALTLRTSIIGHELNSCHSLIDWFLSQAKSVNGYRRAIFSGLPTIEIARILRDIVIQRKNLAGLYHLSGHPIDKFQLLTLVSLVYNKKIKIHSDESLRIDRSLNSDRFRSIAGYQPRSWEQLVRDMYDDYCISGFTKF